jgi:hypothetical protein
MSTFAEAMTRRESRVVLLVRRGMIAVACIYAVSFSWSIYRRINQILRIDAHATSRVLAPGSRVGYDVITSGEVQNRIRLELVQGARSELLREQRANVNRISGLDPRVFRNTSTVTITPVLLARFRPGPANASAPPVVRIVVVWMLSLSARPGCRAAGPGCGRAPARGPSSRRSRAHAGSP